MKRIELKPIRETKEDFEAIEKKIREAFRKNFYAPLLKSLGYSGETILNSRLDLLRAIHTGRITFSRGRFEGRFNSDISKEMRELGAQWDRKTRTWKIPKSSLPREVTDAISSSFGKFQEKIADLDEKLASIQPAELADKVQIQGHFDAALFKVDRDLRGSLKGITVSPKLSDKAREQISKEWENNLKKYIRNFTAEQIPKLRAEIQKKILAGHRYESLVDSIRASYGVTEKKAKFLARQETNLLMSKYKEARYREVGIDEYTWHAVAGTPLHPVRPRHKELAEESRRGKLFKFSDPPNTAEPGQPARYNNPTEDYNCRCFARPVVRFKKS